MNREGTGSQGCAGADRDGIGVLKRILPYLRPFKLHVFLWLMLVLVLICCELAIPLLIEACINLFAENAHLFMILQRIAALLVVFAAIFILEICKNRIAVSVSEGLLYQIRKDLFDDTVHISISSLDNHSYGDLISRLTNDTEQFSTILNVAETMISAATILIGSGILMVLHSANLALIAIALALASTVVIKILSESAREAMYYQKLHMGVLNGTIEESVRHFRTLKLLGVEEYFLKKLRGSSEKYKKSSKKAVLISGVITPLMLLLGNASFIMTMLVGGNQVISGILTVGVLQVMVMYSKQFMESVKQLGDATIQAQNFFAGAKRIFELQAMREPQKKQDASVPARKADERPAAFCFSHVDFAYAEGRPILSDFQMKVEQGETVALIGETGVGKTTVTSLLLGFFQPDNGHIFVGGDDIAILAQGELEQRVAATLQNPYIVSGTVAENIVYGSNQPAEAAEQIVEAMGILPMIARLPHGLETVVSNDTSLLSGSLRQMICLARAMAKCCSLYIFDEATSRIDVDTEQVLVKNIRKYAKNATIVFIAHRLSSLQNVDRIYVMKDGRIKESGTFHFLMENGTEFNRLYELQADGKGI